MMSLRFSVTVLALLQACQAAEVCDNDESCSSARKASAMLQVSTKAHTFHNGDAPEVKNPDATSLAGSTSDSHRIQCDAGSALVETHLEEARLCLPQGLPERHLSALRRQAALLTSRAKPSERALLTSRSQESEKTEKASQVADTSLPLRNGDVIYLYQPNHKTRVGWWGAVGEDFTASCPLSGVKNTIQGYSDTPARTQIEVEVEGQDTYFKNPGHGSYLGICNDASGACGSDTGLASVNGYSSKVDATKFAVEDAPDDHVYLHAKFSGKYLAFACPSSYSTSGAAHMVHGYPTTANSALLQQAHNQSVITRTMLTVEFVSRTTTTTTTTTKATPTAVTHPVTSTAALDFVNVMDGHFKYECGANEVMSSMYSVHDNTHEDRTWKFACSPMSSGSLDNCAWTAYTEYDATWTLGSGNEVVTGIESSHLDEKEDRQYKFKFCELTGVVAKNVERDSDYRNDWDGILDVNLPAQKFLTQIESTHDNVKEDRRFKLTTFELEEAAPTPAPTIASDPSSDPVVASAPSSDVDGATATLDAAGFKAVTSLCCPPEMEVFFGRLLTSMGLDVCSKPHTQGLMHWFSCVPDMDFQYLIDVINNGNPCKYWTETGATCPELSAECQGEWCR